MILVSACLMGENVKYNGENNYSEKIAEFLKDKEYVLVCPEVLGGLSIPRDPSEIIKDKVISKTGKDVTKNFELGALQALEIAKQNKVTMAILKQSSPSCGFGKIYDGTFKNTKIKGNGKTTELLLKEGIKILTEEDFVWFLQG